MKFTRRRLRLASGLVLFAYLASHLANHAAGLISLDAAEAARHVFLDFWRSVPASAALYAAFVVHIGLALMSLYERRTLRMPPAELDRQLPQINIPAPADKRTADARSRTPRTAESSPWPNDWNFIAPAP